MRKNLHDSKTKESTLAIGPHKKIYFICGCAYFSNTLDPIRGLLTLKRTTCDWGEGGDDRRRGTDRHDDFVGLSALLISRLRASTFFFRKRDHFPTNEAYTGQQGSA